MKMVKKIVTICFMLVLVCFGLAGCESDEQQLETAQAGYELYLVEWAASETKELRKSDENAPEVTVEELREDVISCEVRHFDAYSTYYYKLNYRKDGISKTIYFIYLPIEGTVDQYDSRDYEEVVKQMDKDGKPGLTAEIKVR